MEIQKSDNQLTYQEFLEFIADKEGRYEYVNGRAVAMGNPSDIHQALVIELAVLLRTHLAGRPCKVLPAPSLLTSSQERVPDILVKCNKPGNHANEPGYGVPIAVFEILSPNRGDDLESKVTEYEDLPTIKNYLAIDSTKHWARYFYRNTDGLFSMRDSIGGNIHIEAIDYVLDLDGLYRAAAAI